MQDFCKDQVLYMKNFGHLKVTELDGAQMQGRVPCAPKHIPQAVFTYLNVIKKAPKAFIYYN